MQSSHHPAFYIYCLYAFPYSIRFCLPAVTAIANKRPSLYRKNLYCCIGMAGLDRLFSFPLPIFRLLLPILLSVLPHFPSPMAAAELTPIACGPDCPLLFYFPILLKTRRPSFILTSHASSSQSPIHFPQFLLLLRRILRLSVLFLFILHFLLIFISTYSFKSSFS